MRGWALGLVALCWTGLMAAPGQERRPLPDKTEFLAETRRHLDSDERLQSRYTFRERRIEMRQDDSGAWVPKDTQVFEVYPSPVSDLTYYRLVERNGTKVSAHALAAADAKQLAEVARFREKLRGESSTDRVRRLARLKQDADRDRAMVKDVLDTFDFSLVRREQADGQSLIVIAFSPKDDAHPRTSEGRLARHFTGLAWVDEDAHQVVRAEARSVDTVSFGWSILARFERGMRGEFVRSRLADGTWLPVMARLTGVGHLLFVKKIQVGYLSEYFDYRKIDPDDPPRFVAVPELRPDAGRS